MREISLDTETTGLDPATGDRIVEIGCVELHNHAPTGRGLQLYVNPQRPMSPEALEITGLTDAFLAQQPVFEQVAREFRSFIGDDPLVIHNADFDTKFINAEFARLGWPPLDRDRIIDSLAIAKRRFPGAQASLDALCRRFGVDNSARDKHGALLDAELLAEVYLELKGGRQPTLGLSADVGSALGAGADDAAAVTRRVSGPRRSRISEAEKEAHAAFVETLGDALWRTAPPYDAAAD